MESKLEERFLRRRRNLSLQTVKNYDVPSDASSPIFKDDPENYDREDKYVVRGFLNINTESNSNISSNNASSASSPSTPSGNVANATSGSQAYRTKLLGRKERSSRASRAPKAESSSQTNDDIITFLRRAKRSLSAPRKKEDVDQIDPKITPQMQKKKIEKIETEKYEVSNTSASDEMKELLEANLRKFNEDRRKFELEKLKLLEDKRDFDRLRLQRFDKYRKERENNESQIKIARKIVFDYEKLEKEKDYNSVNDKFNVQIEDTSNEKLIVNGNEDSDFHDAESEICVPKAEVNANHANIKISVEPVKEQILTKRKKESLESAISTSQKLEINGHKKESNGVSEKKDSEKVDSTQAEEKVDKITVALLKEILTEMTQVWKEHTKTHANELMKIKSSVKTCAADVVLLMILCGIGGLLFRYVEGNFENIYKCSVKRVKRDFIDQLWTSSHNLKEDDWKSMARTRLRKFEEELHTAFESGMNSYSGHTTWNFVNAVLYCMTLISTIGYGHITPVTTTGRAITIVYAIFGIPIFLILLADFGKLFTRGIKFVWLYVRRLYYTGTFRKIRKSTHTQEMMKGLNTMYAFVRRPSFEPGLDGQTSTRRIDTPDSIRQSEGPSSPVPASLGDNAEIDDEFNLPVTVAIGILVLYMLIGATMYYISEDWEFFESFYFVFVSISTIGLGDFVPKHPIYMLFSIIYLIFGLSLTSMCINVVQLKLSDSFRNASTKISATIGLQMAEAASAHTSEPQSPDLESDLNTKPTETSEKQITEI